MQSSNRTSMCTRAASQRNSAVQRQDDSDIGKYFKDSILCSNSSIKSNSNANNRTSKRRAVDTAVTLQRNESDLDQYFVDNITLSQSKCRNESKENMLDKGKRKRNGYLHKHGHLNKVLEESISSNRVIPKPPKEFNNVEVFVTNATQSSCSNENFIQSTCNLQHLESNRSDNNTLNRNNSKTAKNSVNSQSSCTIELSSVVCTQDHCKLASWGLPTNILRKYEEKGVSNMFPWQVECLSNHKVIQERRNLVYSAPTSAGKTLVAEILLIKIALEQRKKVIFILPFVSVVREKMYYFQDLLCDSGIRVEGFMGGAVPRRGFDGTHIAIATIEKANSLINRLMEDNELSTLGAVIIDELHLLGDSSRGYLLELLLTKLKYMTLRTEEVKIQLIGMSATLPNLHVLAKWLDAELYKTNFRPIPLNEQCKIGQNIYNNKLTFVRSISPFPELEQDGENIIQLCIETISDGHSILIFCTTKQWCEKLALQISSIFCKLGHESSQLGQILRNQLNTTLISETLEQLKRSPSGLDNVLKKTVSFGVAFHHAGLTMDERDIVEGSFRSGSLRVLTATSTLSSGVNLPARRVIIRSPMFGGKILDALTYKQMIGRAGRMGKDTAGESILVCKQNERNAAESLLSASLSPIESCLEDSKPLIRALLEAIASEVVFTPNDVDLYSKCTLLSFTEEKSMDKLSDEAIQFLVDNEFLLVQCMQEQQRWVATPLGKACLAASMPPLDALFLFEELQKARKCFVLDTELHVVYLVTPVNHSNQIVTIDWMVFLEQWRHISESERRVGHLVGVEERFLLSAVRGLVKPGKALNVHRRFYSALALHDLVREMSLTTVCKKYGCCRGAVQSLQQSAATFAGMVTQFCKQLGWDCMELLVAQFQTRLQFGVCRELLDLLRLPMLNGLRARSLYKQGITCVAELAVANELDVERALYKALPFESGKEQDGEEEMDAMKRKKIRTVFVTGRDGLTPQQAAVMLVLEARILVQNELGMHDIAWKSHEQDETNSDIENHANKSQVCIKENIPEDIQTVELKNDKETEAHNMQNEKDLQQLHLNSIRTLVTNTIDEFSDIKNGNTSYKLQCELAVQKNETKGIEQIKEVNAKSDIDNKSCNLQDGNQSEIQVNIRKSGDSLISFMSDKRRCNKKSTIAVEENETVDKISNSKVLDEANITTGLLMQDFSPNQILDKMSSDKNAKLSYTRSPSLFDESLNIDTQVYNVLEQNIFDSLQSSEDAETKHKVSTLVRSAQVQNQDDVLSWKDDSWNTSKGVLRTINKITNKNDTSIANVQNLRNVKNTNLSYVLENTEVLHNTSHLKKRKYSEPTSSESYIAVQDRITQKFKEIPVEKSPIASLRMFNEKRRMSVDSNKSDSDDIIIPSQKTESPSSSIKSRTRQKLEVIRKTAVDKHKDTLITPSKATREIKSKIYKVKPKLKDILSRNIHFNMDINRSMDSVISNSDEDTPVRKLKYVQESNNIQDKVIKPCDVNSIKCNINPNFYLLGCEGNLNQTDWNTLNIINVGSNRTTFNLFRRELFKKTNIALAIHCEMYDNNSHNIGSKVLSSNVTKKKVKKLEHYVYGEKKLTGVAISWEANIAYYISFNNTEDIKVSTKDQINLLKELLSKTSMYITCFATKDVYKLLYQCCGISSVCRFLDPKTADWLLTGNTWEKSFNEMVSEYFPEGHSIIDRIGSCNATGPGLHMKSGIRGEFRTAAEVVLSWHMMEVLLNKLREMNPTLLYTFKEIEMRTVSLLACMELNGLGVNLKALQELSSVILDQMSSLEKQAYTIAGNKFNFLSPKEVAQVLGLYKGTKVSVNKAKLEQCNNPLSKLIISWRKLNATQTRTVYPLLNLAQSNSRIHGNCIMYTSTGRISMNEPNLQNIPKDFNSEDNSFVISVRMAFIPNIGNIMLSADYCQIELRILAHFSKDRTLCEIMQQKGDLFKSIAAKWNHVTEEQVDDKMRQHTKQLCYGMIYGMGTKTLAETLCVEEADAKKFLESFMDTYPGIQQWLNDVTEQACKDGYVTTLMERRRLLSGLNSVNPSEKSQAERQAVNTKVQGSAADIAKKAMIDVEDRMRYEFPRSAIILPETLAKRKLRSHSRDMLQNGGYLVLQLHDELLYEVNLTDLHQVARIVKESMEHVCQLAVPLPVKIKVGPAWGDFTEYQF